MRVKELLRDRRRRPDDERGAVVVLVAICLVAIFAMVVLTVDVGGLLVKRRHLVNGSDAAALAAAQECADRTPPADYEVQADAFAADNVAGLTPSDGGVVEIVGCDTSSGHVTVRYTHPQPLFFAGVLGFGDSANVQTEATAAWGPAGSAPNPVPVVLNLSTFQGNCDIPNVDMGQECYLWYDNDRFSGSNFGWLDLEQWDVPATESCNSSGGASQLEDWIDGNYEGPPLTLNYPDPTYVCTTSGHRSSTFDHLASHVGETLMFPINDQSGQITKSNGQILLYDIIGFASLRLDAVYKANQAPPECGPPPGNNSSHCLITSWQGYTFGGGEPGGGGDFGTFGIRLCDIDLGTCPPGS